MNKQLPIEERIILDLCGGTGSWSKPYKDAGYDVRLVTLPDNDVTTYKLPDEPIYGILAAPPCTMFSFARTRAKRPRDLNEGMETVEACLRLIWEARKRGRFPFGLCKIRWGISVSSWGNRPSILTRGSLETLGLRGQICGGTTTSHERSLRT